MRTDKPDASTAASTAAPEPQLVIFDGIEPGSFHYSDVVNEHGHVRGTKTFHAGDIVKLEDVPDAQRVIELKYGRILPEKEAREMLVAKLAREKAAAEAAEHDKV